MSQEITPAPAKSDPLRRGAKKGARKTAKKAIDLSSHSGEETLDRSVVPSDEPKKRRGRPKKVIS
ncbi:MAG: hypothetical protein IJG83_06615, partial [Thermoguttaceae bacterium]|nr:hypothetical protein [Thermoguttaceae bacterium]